MRLRGFLLPELSGLCEGEFLDPECSCPVKRGFRKGVCWVKIDTYSVAVKILV